MIPHPAAQGAAKVAAILHDCAGRKAGDDRRALPVVAGLAARAVVQNRGAMMSPAQRKQVVRTMTRAAKTLVASGGAPAIRALPKITRSVRRTAGARATPAGVQP